VAMTGPDGRCRRSGIPLSPWQLQVEGASGFS
jgi:hypothetical protein